MSMSVQNPPCPTNIRGKKSFTLVELLLVTAVIAVLSLSLCRALSVGLKVWESSRVVSVEEDMMIFLDKISMDLRNAIKFSLFKFEGKPNVIRIPSIVSAAMGREGMEGVYAYAHQPGIVEYGLDSARQSIYLRKAHYGQAVDDDFGPKSFLVSRIKRLSFKYFDRSPQGLTARKLGQETLPAAVEVDIQYQDRHGDMQTLGRLINLPVNM